MLCNLKTSAQSQVTGDAVVHAVVDTTLSSGTFEANFDMALKLVVCLFVCEMGKQS